MEIFAWGLFLRFSRFCLLRENYPHAKIKTICLYEGKRSSTVKITPMWNVLPTFSRNFPPAKITTFTVIQSPIAVSEYSMKQFVSRSFMDKLLMHHKINTPHNFTFLPRVKHKKDSLRFYIIYFYQLCIKSPKTSISICVNKIKHMYNVLTSIMHIQ